MKDSWSTMHRNVRCREIRCAAPLKVKPGLKNKIICHRLSPTIWANWTDFQLSSLERHKVYLNIISMILSYSFCIATLWQPISEGLQTSSPVDQSPLPLPLHLHLGFACQFTNLPPLSCDHGKYFFWINEEILETHWDVIWHDRDPMDMILVTTTWKRVTCDRIGNQELNLFSQMTLGTKCSKCTFWVCLSWIDLSFNLDIETMISWDILKIWACLAALRRASAGPQGLSRVRRRPLKLKMVTVQKYKMEK